MAIYKAVRKDLGTGSVTGNSEQSYVIPYFVFTDNTDTPYDIYAKARSSEGIIIYDVDNKPTKDRLPVFGTVSDEVRVSDIKMERSSENNLKAVPQYGLHYNDNRNRSYTCWLYTVTFTANTTTTVSSGDAPWTSDEAISCTWSPKSYERYDNRTLKPNFVASKKNIEDVQDSDVLEDTPVPNYPLNKEEYVSLKNTVGDDLYRDRMVYNYVLNFSYAVRNFNYEYLPLFLGSMNLKDCVIAGVPIKKYKGVINDMRVTQADWNGTKYYTVDVEIEVEYGQKLTYDEYMSSGHRAFMIEGSTTGINNYLSERELDIEKAGFVYKYTDADDDDVKVYPVPIEELTDVRQRDNVPDDRWFLKKKNLGYFEGIDPSRDTIENYDSRVVFITSGTLGSSSQITVSYVDPNKVTPDSSNSETLYYQNVQKDDEFWYSTSSISPTPANMRVITRYVYYTSTPSQSGGTTTIVEDGNGGYTVSSNESSDSGTTVTTAYEYRVKIPSFGHSESKQDDDRFAGQYNSLQNPVALTKYGGVYFGKGEERTVDDFTRYGSNEIDMYDPMLGKVKDYQHVARDWSALAFPRKGMFHTDIDVNNRYMSKVTNYFKN